MGIALRRWKLKKNVPEGKRGRKVEKKGKKMQDKIPCRWIAPSSSLPPLCSSCACARGDGETGSGIGLRSVTGSKHSSQVASERSKPRLHHRCSPLNEGPHGFPWTYSQASVWERKLRFHFIIFLYFLEIGEILKQFGHFVIQLLKTTQSLHWVVYSIHNLWIYIICKNALNLLPKGKTCFKGSKRKIIIILWRTHSSICDSTGQIII